LRQMREYRALLAMTKGFRRKWAPGILELTFATRSSSLVTLLVGSKTRSDLCGRSSKSEAYKFQALNPEP